MYWNECPEDWCGCSQRRVGVPDPGGIGIVSICEEMHFAVVWMVDVLPERSTGCDAATRHTKRPTLTCSPVGLIANIRVTA